MDDCLFCKIAQGEIPSEFLYEDEYVVAFRDVNPQAPVHVLIVPKAHYANIADNVPAEVLKAMQQAVSALSQKLGIDESGFRCIMNTGPDGGQSVMHLHMHLLGGCNLGERLRL